MRPLADYGRHLAGPLESFGGGSEQAAEGGARPGISGSLLSRGIQAGGVKEEPILVSRSRQEQPERRHRGC
jgi:hypothetical protein